MASSTHSVGATSQREVGDDGCIVIDHSSVRRSRGTRGIGATASATRYAGELGKIGIKSECLNRVVPLGERHLVRLIDEYVDHYHAERPHQGIANVPPDAVPESVVGAIKRRDRLGGLLCSYYREAA